MERTAPYFDFWTPEENNLVQSKRFFTLAINFSDYQDTENVIYEYDPMLVDILELSSEIIHNGGGYSMHNLIKFSVDAQYILVRRDCDFDVALIGQYSTNEEAINVINADQFALDSDDDDTYQYVIINLEYTKPYFFKLGILTQDDPTKNIKRKEAGIFYSGSASEPIIFK